ncbi:Uncharacterised protein [Yersinia enterocolitica]|nr:Uncharacterised protein [Yersinia enterocolitica]
MDNALEWVIQVIQRHAEFSTVLDKFLHLNAGHFTTGIDIFGLCRNVVIHGGKGFTRLTHRAAHGAQAIKGLRRCHFMH